MERTSSHATTERIPWLAVAVASLGYFVDLYDLVVFSVVRVPSLGAQGLGLPDAAAGAHTGFVEGLLRMGRILLGMEQGDVTSAGAAILNVQLTGMLIGGFLWGMLGDRRGRLTTLFGSIALYSTANLLNAFVHTVPQYAALRFIAGIGLAGELGAGVTLVSELMNRHHRGWGTMIVAFAGMFGPIAASLVGNWLDWRQAYMLGAIMGFGLLALRIGLSESGMFRRSEREHARRGDLRMLFLSPERLRRFACVVGLATPIWFVGGVVFVFGPELAKERLSGRGGGRSGNWRGEPVAAEPAQGGGGCDRDVGDRTCIAVHARRPRRGMVLRHHLRGWPGHGLLGGVRDDCRGDIRHQSARHGGDISPQSGAVVGGDLGFGMGTTEAVARRRGGRSLCGRGGSRRGAAQRLGPA